ncbi:MULTISPECIES: type II toxin-antitoxin system VapC family toxin [Rhodopseudomonas]|uniref:DNA-binding protein n=1 Tax=Rhodopseudomonas palustris TaxID=1076 RepID=A0A0D7EDB6_RHOPL|nr:MULTISPECIES: type II toxin-antitoxin system VapC family toxin [Rhodopseudomonas]KIZ38814.1 DNA-binding protein [Rhodopseudomonas palustris]MDF3810890.1 type II toxin-antitoxin system VapC family toxin [Rhodopseudomonas sp. BAL398]WOK18257.1 type II toxin-antitoxin system VapC family toxin [Rhodopseudomonas sp. BAL398]
MTLVDTNILIDILSADRNWQLWSAAALRQQSLHGLLLINEIVYAELSARYTSQQKLDAAIDLLDLHFEWLPKSALYIAGQTFNDYRRSGGIRTSILADFFIGAHAAAGKVPILTRDTGRYRRYFPDVELIAPG